MEGIFLDASVLDNKIDAEVEKFDIKKNRIQFEFPQGFNDLRLIEECRALNALDITVPDNFDLMFDITMQLLAGRVMVINFIDNMGKPNCIASFVVNDRYYNLRSISIIDEYPILVNWLVEFVASMLGKKYPRSLKSIRELMSGKEEPTKKSPSKKKGTKES